MAARKMFKLLSQDYSFKKPICLCYVHILKSLEPSARSDKHGCNMNSFFHELLIAFHMFCCESRGLCRFWGDSFIRCSWQRCREHRMQFLLGGFACGRR